MDETNSDIST